MASDLACGGGGGGKGEGEGEGDGGACLRTSQKCSDDMKVSEDVAYMRQVLRSCCKLKVNQSWHACVS